MKMTMLGTGHAMVTHCYNTCYILHDEDHSLLVDGGGGNGLIRQFQQIDFDPKSIHHIFVTHKHVDHILGIVWLMRVITSGMARHTYEGDAYIYSHDQVLEMLDCMARGLLQPKEYEQVGKRLHLVEVHDTEELQIAGTSMQFFDIRSPKAKQFGYRMTLNDGKTITCYGDEPCNPTCERYAENADWMFHEAFCLRSQADIYKPYEKRHSTVADACETAQRLGVKNLVLYHTEDHDIAHRKQRYLAEGHPLFDGGLYVPDDLETIDL